MVNLQDGVRWANSYFFNQSKNTLGWMDIEARHFSFILIPKNHPIRIQYIVMKASKLQVQSEDIASECCFLYVIFWINRNYFPFQTTWFFCGGLCCSIFNLLFSLCFVNYFCLSFSSFSLAIQFMASDYPNLVSSNFFLFIFQSWIVINIYMLLEERGILKRLNKYSLCQ